MDEEGARVFIKHVKLYEERQKFRSRFALRPYFSSRLQFIVDCCRSLLNIYCSIRADNAGVSNVAMIVTNTNVFLFFNIFFYNSAVIIKLLSVYTFVVHFSNKWGGYGRGICHLDDMEKNNVTYAICLALSCFFFLHYFPEPL